MTTATAAEPLWIASDAWQAIQVLAQAHYPFETGGMLIGYQADDTSVVVTNVIGPGPKAKHARLWFRPDHDYQQNRLDEVFRNSNGGKTYLGDWHTHPNGISALSRKDRRVLRRIAETPEAQTPNPIMLVLAIGAGAEDKLACCVQYEACKRNGLFISEYNLKSLTIHQFN